MHALKRFMNSKRFSYGWVVAFLMYVAAPPLFATTVQDGSLTTYSRGSGQPQPTIPPRVVKRLLEHYIPSEAKKLLVFGQCYGGDTTQFFGNMPNTAIASGTSTGQEAHYGGYHDDAAQGLRPGDGRTGQDVHNAGNDGKYRLPPTDGQEPSAAEHRVWSERPMTGGGLSLSNFSLENTSATGAVRSRHVVIYMGRPETRRERIEDRNGKTVPTPDGDRRDISDASGRDAIKNNFKNQQNTTVTSVGGPPDPNNPRSGQDGWDHPGNLDGLEAAIRQAGNAIRRSGHPDKEQFILFVGDHGEGTRADLRSTTVPGNSRSVVSDAFQPFAEDASVIQHALVNPYNVSGFSIFLDYDGTATPIQLDRTTSGDRMPFFAPDDFRLEITPQNRDTLVLRTFGEQPFDLDADDVLGLIPGEGISLFFPVSEAIFMDRLLGGNLEIAFVNNTASDVTITEVAQTAGVCGRQGPVPPSVPETGFRFGGGLTLDFPGAFPLATVIGEFSIDRNLAVRTSLDVGSSNVLLNAGLKSYLRSTGNVMPYLEGGAGLSITIIPGFTFTQPTVHGAIGISYDMNHRFLGHPYSLFAEAGGTLFGGGGTALMVTVGGYFSTSRDRGR